MKIGRDGVGVRVCLCVVGGVLLGCSLLFTNQDEIAMRVFDTQF